MTLKKIVFSLLMTSSIPAFPQPDPAISQNMGITFGGPKNDRGVHIIKTSDNHLVTIGVTHVEGNGQDIFVVKTDLAGNKVWEKTFGGNKDDAGWYIMEDSQDEHYILSGWSDSYSKDRTEDILVMKISKDGELIWYKNFENPGAERCWSLNQLTDGHLMLVGQTQNLTTRKMYGLVTKITRDGELIWQKTYGDENYNRLFYSTETNTGELFIAGITRKDSLNENYGWTLLIDREGTQVKTNRLANIKNITTHGVLPISANEIMIIGYAQTDTAKNQRAIYLAMFDNKGTLKWERTTNDKNAENHGIGAIKSSTRSIFITGYTRPLGARKWQGMIYNFSAKGKMKWRKEFGGNESDQPYGIIELPDNKCVVAGLTNSFGKGGTDLWLVWLDHKGNLIQ